MSHVNLIFIIVMIQFADVCTTKCIYLVPNWSTNHMNQECLCDSGLTDMNLLHQHSKMVVSSLLLAIHAQTKIL